MTVESGTLQGDVSALSLNAGTATINGGTFTGASDGIVVEAGQLTMTGGTVTAARHALLVSAGTASVENATLISTFQSTVDGLSMNELESAVDCKAEGTLKLKNTTIQGENAQGLYAGGTVTLSTGTKFSMTEGYAIVTPTKSDGNYYGDIREFKSMCVENVTEDMKEYHYLTSQEVEL